MKFNFFLFLLFGTLPLNILQAQEGFIFNFMRLNPYKSYDSPATENPHNGYFSIPGTGDINVGIFNSSIRYNNLFQSEEGYPTTLTANTFVNSLSKNNYLNSSINISILSFGFRVKKTFLSFDYRIRANEKLKYSKDVLALPVLGNLAYLGDDNPAKLYLNVNLNAYQEFSVNIQHTINKHFSFGIRPKYLAGLINVTNAQIDAQLTTNADTYAMRLAYIANGTISSIIPYEASFSDGDANFNWHVEDFNYQQAGNYFNNHGFGLDLGFIYNINDRFSLSLSMLDMGFIYWQTYCTQLHSEPTNNGHLYQDGALAFSGLTTTEIEALMQDDETRRQFLDSLSCYFPINGTAIDGYTSALATRGLLQFDFNLNKQNRFSAVIQAQFSKKTCIPAFSLAYEGCFANCIDVCAAYTIAPNNYSNFGVGLGFRFGIFNLYMATENILPAFNPTILSRWNARLGIAFTFGKYE